MTPDKIKNNLVKISCLENAQSKSFQLKDIILQKTVDDQ